MRALSAVAELLVAHSYATYIRLTHYSRGKDGHTYLTYLPAIWVIEIGRVVSLPSQVEENC